MLLPLQRTCSGIGHGIGATVVVIIVVGNSGDE